MEIANSINSTVIFSFTEKYRFATYTTKLLLVSIILTFYPLQKACQIDREGKKIIYCFNLTVVIHICIFSFCIFTSAISLYGILIWYRFTSSHHQTKQTKDKTIYKESLEIIFFCFGHSIFDCSASYMVD